MKSETTRLRQAMAEAKIMLEYDPPEVAEALRLLREGLYPGLTKESDREAGPLSEADPAGGSPNG